MAFASACARGFDVRQDAAKRAEFASLGVAACESMREAVASADVTLSLVTADQALAASKSAAAHLSAGALWLDMNSVAPDTKRAAAVHIEAAGASFVDVAVMAPVLPKRLEVPLLVAGPRADDAAEALRALGFANVQVVAGGVGAAAAVKMIRSVMIKGLEALSAECALAAEEAGILSEVIASLNASSAVEDWADRFNYNLERMIVHGVRRAAEMSEVVATLDSLGTGSAMSLACAQVQAGIGSLRARPPHTLQAKLKTLRSMRTRNEAA